MSKIRPFQALRPVPEKAQQVAAVPYDVVSTSEAQTLAKGNPWSFLHVSRPEIDLPPQTDPYSEVVYNKAAENFTRLIQECPLIKEQKPMLYLYRLRMGQHEQTGIFGTFAIEEYESNRIKKHEKTRADKEDDRTRHVLKLSAQTGPAFLTYRDVPEINQAMEKIKAFAPLYDFIAPDKIGHTLWQITDPDRFVELFDKSVECLYIADGHHRAAAASRTRTEMMKQNPHHTGNENYNYLLAVAFPGSHLKILPYHRVIKTLGGLSQDQFLKQVRSAFEVSESESLTSQPREFGMYFQGQWYSLRPKIIPDRSALDVTLLQESLLEPILGIGDPRTDKRIDFVGGIRGTKELERLVDSNNAAVAFSLHPVSLEALMQIADQSGIMPPKSTWFEPKLRDGLISHCI